MRLELPPEVCSASDVATLAGEISGYTSWTRQNSIKKRLKVRDSSTSPLLSAAAREILRDYSVKHPLTPASLDELARALEKFKDDAPSLTFVLAAPAGAGLKKQLVAWCRQNVASDILVNFEFNSALLGGMVIRYGSRIFDWSFRRAVLDNRQKFTEVLANV